MALKDYYEILGLKRTASAAQIKEAYYILAKKYHPDSGMSPERSAEKFKEISEAYKVLGDLDNRLNYSIQLHRLDIEKKLKNKTIDIPALRMYAK